MSKLPADIDVHARLADILTWRQQFHCVRCWLSMTLSATAAVYALHGRYVHAARYLEMAKNW